MDDADLFNGASTKASSRTMDPAGKPSTAEVSLPWRGADGTGDSSRSCSIGQTKSSTDSVMLCGDARGGGDQTATVSGGNPGAGRARARGPPDAAAVVGRLGGGGELAKGRLHPLHHGQHVDAAALPGRKRCHEQRHECREELSLDSKSTAMRTMTMRSAFRFKKHAKLVAAVCL